MGNSTSNETKPRHKEDLFKVSKGVHYLKINKLPSDFLCGVENPNILVDKESKDVLRKKEYPKALGCMFGMVIGDALGAPLEFCPVDYNRPYDLKGFHDEHLWRNESGTMRRTNRFGLHPGQWTDDSSQGFCLADSLIANQGKLDLLDFKLRMNLWAHCGYNNAFL